MIMIRSFRNLYLRSLCVLLLPACGVELDQDAESDNAAELAQAAVNQTHGDVATGAQKPAQVVLANQPSLLAPMEPLALILIDRTGSMSTVRPSTTNTRCVDAVHQAKVQLDQLAANGANSFAVWTFAGSSVTQRVSYTSKMTAGDVIDSLLTETCTDNTPLAYAMCAAAQNLGATRASPGNIAFLAVSTDGGENNSTGSPLLTPGSTNCSGPSGDITTAGTWEHNVETYIGTTIGNIKVDDTYWVDPVLGQPFRSAASAVAATCSGAQCDDAFFASLSNVTGGNFRRAADTTTTYPCASAAACAAPDSTNLGNRFDFSAINTNNATVNTVNYSVYLLAGETLTAGTCGVTGATGSGDTVLRLSGPSGALLASNDDSCGVLSKLSFTVPADGTYLINAGCFSINSCSGTVAYTIQGSFNYSATATNSATVNTVNHNLYLRPAQNIALGTCGVAGSSGVGDTFLRLFDPSAVNVALNDDSCGVLSSLSYNVPAGAAGTHQLHAGCFASGSCSGTVSYLITQP
jgi:hypothetical protein